MYKRIASILAVILSTGCIAHASIINIHEQEVNAISVETKEVIEETVTYNLEPVVYTPDTIVCEEIIIEESTDPVNSITDLYSEEEIDLLALVTMAEAEGESVLGQRLVIDTILNRVDSSNFPNDISSVIYQKNAFTSMHNGRVDRCYVKDDIRELVVEELNSRTNTEVVYFTAGRYSKYGIKMFSEGNHYFSRE